MKNYRPIKNIEFRDMERGNLMFRNFSGRPGRYNKNGDKTFCVRIDNPEIAEELNNEGWNIKILQPREEGELPGHYLPVAIAFNNYPPQIYIHSRGKSTKLDNDTVGTLDDADIVSFDVVIRPYQYERDDGTMGVKAYVKYMHVTIESDPFSDKYAEEEYPSEHMPW